MDTTISGKITAAVEAAFQKFFGKGKDSNEATTTVEKPAAEAPGAITAEMQGAIQAAVEKQMATVQGQLTQAQADLATAQQTIGTLQTQITAKDGELTTLKASATTVDEAAADKARKLVAGQGVAVEALPAGKEGKSADAKTAAEKEYARLITEGKSLEAGRFWQKNRELLD